MKVAPVSADLLIKLSLAVAVMGGIWYLGRRVADSLPSLPDFSGWELPSRYTEVELQASYQEALTAARSDPNAGSFWSLFTHNPNNFNPTDLIPPGYHMNQWGVLEPITPPSTGGATGSW